MGVVFGEEVVGGSADLGDVVEVGIFREGAAEAGQRIAAPNGGKRRGSGFVAILSG